MSRKHHVNLTFADDAGRTRSITMKVASRIGSLFIEQKTPRKSDVC
nr:MAG TPA: hypothetical protein [Caudoviricetes sp.]